MSRTNNMRTCREMVELVTDYLEGRLADFDRKRFEAHVDRCDACALYIEQMRVTISALGRIPPETISETTSPAWEVEPKNATSVRTDSGFGTTRSQILVATPSVPSEPTNAPTRS